MPTLDRQQLIGVLMSLVVVLFVGRGLLKEPYRTWLQRASIAGYLLMAVLVVGWIAMWLLARAH